MGEVWQKGKVLCFEYQMKENHLGETQLEDWKAVVRGLIIGELELEYKNSSNEDPESVRVILIWDWIINTPTTVSIIKSR